MWSCARWGKSRLRMGRECENIFGMERLMHQHRWEDTRINPYGIATEQRCKCGEYRYHLAADLHGVNMGGEPAWRPGRHPAEVSGNHGGRQCPLP
jgi:hypothetical protein